GDRRDAARVPVSVQRHPAVDSHAIRRAGRYRPQQQLAVFGRPPASRRDVRADARELQTLAARSRQQYPKENANVDAALYRLSEEVSEQSRLLRIALCGAAGCVLLIACANLANLLLARAIGRRRELAVRTAIGAGRERMIRQLLTESLLLAAVGGAVGVVVARTAVPLLTRLVPVTLPTAGVPAVDSRVLL